MELGIKIEDGGRKEVLRISSDATWEELLTAIYLNFDASPLTVSAGFPPKTIPLDTTDPSTLLRELSIVSGQLLTIKLSNTPPSISGSSIYPKMTIRQMPDDNSCLFRAVSYLLCNCSRECAQDLRKLVATHILSHPDVYTAAMLAMNPSTYAQKIQCPDAWGGAIEISIFASHFTCELASVDVQTGRVDVFGESLNYGQRAYLLYSGIHYDAISMATSSSEHTDLTIFQPTDQSVFEGALELAQEAKRAHKYTDTAHFTLRCEECGMGVVGEQEANSHALQTGHSSFIEY